MRIALRFFADDVIPMGYLREEDDGPEIVGTLHEATVFGTDRNGGFPTLPILLSQLCHYYHATFV